METASPVASWLDYLQCLGVILVVASLGGQLRKRGLYNGIMSLGSLVYLLCFVRFRSEWYRVGYVIFFLGACQALSQSRYRTWINLVLAALMTVLWFRWVFWTLLAFIYYYCSGCLP